MSISSALSAAVSGLNAAQSRAQTVASNIANANTEGYVRRTTNLTERVVAGSGQGVDVSSVSRNSSPVFTEERQRLEAENGFASFRAGTAAQIATLFGEPGVEQGLFGAYARFESALRDASASPESSVLQQQVLETAKSITQEFDRLSERSSVYRTNADNEIDSLVTRVNDSLRRLEEINSLGTNALQPAVLDERDRLINDINEIVPVNVQQVDSRVFLTTDSGFSLLSGNANYLEFEPTRFIDRSSTLDTGLSGLSSGITDLTPGTDASQAIRGGRLAAAFEARDQSIPAFEDTLDALAEDLVARFADDTTDPSKPVGEAGLFTVGNSNVVPAAGTTGLASRLSINAAIDPDQGGELYRLRDGIGATAQGPAGNGEQFARLVDAFTGPRSTSPTLGGATVSASALVSGVASDINYNLQRTEENAVYAAARFDTAFAAEQSVTGVDTDTELQNLIQIEQAYAANARVIETISQLMDQLLRI